MAKTLITLTPAGLPKSAVQKDYEPGVPHYIYGPARHFQDKANWPQGTPNDGKINVIRNLNGVGVVIDRVDTEKAALSTIMLDSGCSIIWEGRSTDIWGEPCCKIGNAS